MSTCILIRGLALTATGAFVVGAGGLLGSGTAAAGTYVYDLSSEAVAVQSTMTDPQLPLGLPFSVGSYGASSILNSNGESSADAGAPYSPLVSSFPSTGNGLVQSATGFGLPVVPTFPGYVRAKDPVVPTDKQNAGGYELVATALPKEATGKVSVGGQAATSEENNAFAVANSVATDEGIFSEGAAGAHALSFDGILDLVNVSSYASLTQPAGGEIVPVTTTSLGTVTFSGLVSGLTGDGLSAFGSAPTPLDVGGLAALNTALKPAGVELTYLPAEYRYADGSTSTGSVVDPNKHVAGVTSGALRVFFTTTSERGTTTETITVGRVVVSATGTVLDGSGSSTGTAGASGGVDGANLGTDTAGLPTAGVGLTALPGTVPGGSLGGALPTRNFSPAAAAGTFVDEGTTSLQSFYLFLALAGAIALAGSQVVRVVAVRRST